MALSDLKARAERKRDAITWRPDLGEHKTEIGGELIALEYRDSEYADADGEPKTAVLTIADEASEVVYRWTAFGAVAADRVARARPAVGDLIYVEYRGLGDPKPGRKAPKLYEVEVEHRGQDEEPPAWDPKTADVGF